MQWIQRRQERSAVSPPHHETPKTGPRADRRRSLQGLNYAAGQAQLKPQDEDKDRQANARGGLGKWTGRLGRGLRNLVSPTLTKEQIHALTRVRDLLAANKLGGADQIFNFGDREAVIAALMQDTAGLRAETQAQLQAEGKGFQARVVGRALSGGRGPLARAARKKVMAEAPGRIDAQLSEGLSEGGISPETGATPDTTDRNLTFAELREFEQHLVVLQQLQKEIGQRLGLDISFPAGVSRASIEHTLNRRLGPPPGARLTPRQAPGTEQN